MLQNQHRMINISHGNLGLKYRSYTYILLEMEVSHSYCLSNCLRFETIGRLITFTTATTLEFNIADTGSSNKK